MENAVFAQTTTTEPMPAEALATARKRLLNPRSAEFLRDPYATYRVLREQAPLYYDEATHAWIATRYHDMHAVLRDPRFGRDPKPSFEVLHGKGINDEPVFRNYTLMMLERDDPDHGRLRNLVNGSFNARRVLALKPAIERIANALIDRMPARGEVELMSEFARALPVIVICELLGVPEGDRQRFLDKRVVSERILQPKRISPEELAAENRRFLELRAYFLALCEQKRQALRAGTLAEDADLTTELVAAHDRRELSEDELVAMIVLIFSAGHDTTVNLIGNALVALHEHPQQLALLRANPQLMPQAIDELLRYSSSVQVSARRALEDVELGGQQMKAGELVLCVLGSANRDPDVYPDPDRLDIERSGTKPVAFGGGIHFCLGAQLARIEGQIALGTLLARLPDHSLLELDNPNWAASVILRGLESLSVRYDRKLDEHVDVTALARPSASSTPARRCPFH